LNGPADLQFGGPGNEDDLFVGEVDGDTVARITPNGTVSTFATGVNYPDGLAFDTVGNLYVLNRGTNEILRVGPTGGVATVFVSGLPGLPLGITFDSNGNLLVGDFDGGTIAQVTPGGVMTNIGSGFMSPEHLRFEPDGVNLFISDFSANTIYKATPITVVAPGGQP